MCGFFTCKNLTRFVRTTNGVIAGYIALEVYLKKGHENPFVAADLALKLALDFSTHLTNTIVGQDSSRFFKGFAGVLNIARLWQLSETEQRNTFENVDIGIHTLSIVSNTLNCF